MKKNLLIIALLSACILCGCSSGNGNDGQQAGMAEENDDLVGDWDGAEKKAPTKEEVLVMREQVLEGMSAEETRRLTENIKVANLSMESAYLKENIFEELEDKGSLYWNYFDEKGEIQVGWSYEGDYHDIISIMDKENLSLEEFYAEYGTPVMVYNRFDAGNFIELMGEMKEIVKNEKLQDDLQKIMDETSLAAATHETQHVYQIFQLLHDMDYYLLRYGPEDVGKYVKDISMISKYCGVLSVYDSSSNDR